MTTLASDDMQGRKTGTEGNRKAAAFIAEEFQKLGLVPMEGNDGYYQYFSLYNLKPQKHKVKINGQTLSSKDVLVLNGRENIKLKKSSQVETLLIKKEDSFREKFAEYRQKEGDFVVLVHPSHQEEFSNYNLYFGIFQPQVELNEKHFSAWTLSEDSTLNKVKIQLKYSIEENKMHNIIGVLPGASDEKILLSAHYDHIGIIAPIQGDSIANGADDDATGVTAIIQLAKHFKEKGNKRTLVFAAFDAEEIGLIGSKHFAEQITPEEYVANVNIEMIGKPSDRGIRKAYVTGYDKSNMGKLMRKAAASKGFRFFADPYKEYNLFMRADNASFAQYNIPAHTISSDPIDFDSYYHTVNDEISTLDLKNMNSIIEGIAAGIAPMVDGSVTPSRLKFDRKK
ncbi:hypothetical protein GCM10023331_35520 [Algivirga pacifica]|uniref:Peptidase M28 domain-containing protein n=2 Tax=Algivirga pacifica TaxID=1162670 RepID=A0ABP9DKI8_9BACT